MANIQTTVIGSYPRYPQLIGTDFNTRWLVVPEDNLDKGWKDKEIPEEFRIAIFNIILRKASVRALQLEEELNLPYHMPFPSIKSQEEKK